MKMPKHYKYKFTHWLDTTDEGNMFAICIIFIFIFVLSITILSI